MKISKSSLGNPLAEGGEGFIYEMKGRIIKVYKPTVALDVKRAKIERLMTKALPTSVVAPEDLVYDGSGKFMGYVMRRIIGNEFKMLSNRKFVSAHNITVRDTLSMLVNIRNVLNVLHRQGIVVGDLNDSNILFDNAFNVFFIDVDSWAVDEFRCSVAMEAFKDPELVGDNFTPATDSFAFSVLAFKSLTRLHPFGGITKPDMDITTRMARRMSVLRTPNVAIPRNIVKWDFMAPSFLEDLVGIFEDRKRFLLGPSLDDFSANLTQCVSHKDYYYSRFNDCPLCSSGASIVERLITRPSADSIPLLSIFSTANVKIIIDFDIYIDNDGNVIHRKSGNGAYLKPGNHYYFSDDGNTLYVVSPSDITIAKKGVANSSSITKLFKSPVVVHDDRLYMVSLSGYLQEIIVSDKGIGINQITQVSYNSVFDVVDAKTYAVCNIYDNAKIFNINGYNYVASDLSKIVNYGIHHDPITGRWLFILEDTAGRFTTYVFKNNTLEYSSNTRYQCPLNNICFYGGIIYTPEDDGIKGFNYRKNTERFFNCDVVTPDSKLIMSDAGKFIIINDKSIYQFG